MDVLIGEDRWRRSEPWSHWPWVSSGGGYRSDLGMVRLADDEALRLREENARLRTAIEEAVLALGIEQALRAAECDEYLREPATRYTAQGHLLNIEKALRAALGAQS